MRILSRNLTFRESEVGIFKFKVCLSQFLNLSFQSLNQFFLFFSLNLIHLQKVHSLQSFISYGQLYCLTLSSELLGCLAKCFSKVALSLIKYLSSSYNFFSNLSLSYSISCYFFITKFSLTTILVLMSLSYLSNFLLFC